MKAQKKIVYVSLMALIVLIILYSGVLINDEGSKLFEFFKNILVGIIGSMFVSLIIGLITYFDEKHKTLESFLELYVELLNHCGSYQQEYEIKDKIRWFDGYVKIFNKLDKIWSEIDFIYDRCDCLAYLTEVRNYYSDFIALTEDNFFSLRPDEGDYNIYHINRIEDIIFQIEVVECGLVKHNIRHNRLNHDMGIVITNIKNIYLGKYKSKKHFDKRIVLEENFILLDCDEEKWAKEINSIIDINSSCTILIDMPKEICKSLQEKGYIGSYWEKNNHMYINCRTLLTHYFELKSRLL